MQNLDWNKCFQQVRDIGLHFPFVHGLAVGMYLCSPRSDHPGRLGGCAPSEEDNYCHQARLIGGCSNHGLGIVYMEPVQSWRNMQEVGQMEPCALFISPTNLSDINLAPPLSLSLYLHFHGEV